MEVQPERCISISFEPTSKKNIDLRKKSPKTFANSNISPIFAPHLSTNMVAVVQLVRASDCGSECRGFESHLPPARKEENR